MGYNTCQAILTIHALLGCDTTSRLSNIGKGIALTKFKVDDEFQTYANVFSSPQAGRDEIIEVETNLLFKVYGAKLFLHIRLH